MSSSTIYTVGTALRRAHENGLTVSVLVEGHWLDGQIGGLDGDGLLLAADDDSHAVVRLSSITAVKVGRPAATPSTPYEGRPMPQSMPDDPFTEPDLPTQREEPAEPDWSARRTWGESVALAVVAAVHD